MSSLIFFQTKRFFTVCVIFIVAISLLLTGCASQYGRQTTVINYYPNCYSPIAQLREEEKKFVHNVATGAIVGTIVGAAIGAAVGGARGAAIGAGAGALAGGGIAAVLTKYKQVEDDKLRRSYLSKDMATEAATLDHVGLSAAMASKCYKEEFDRLLADYKSGSMSRENFQARATEIISGLNEITQITKSFNKEAETRMTQYQQMLGDEAKKDNTELPPIQARELVVAPAPAPEPEPEPQPKPKTKKGTAAKRSSAKAKAKSQEPTGEKKGQETSVLALVQQGGGPEPAKSPTMATPSQQALQPDVSTLPNVIATQDRELRAQNIQTTADSSLKSGPDPTSLPGVIAQRDNYKAQVAKLDAVQRENTSTTESCISQAEAAGIEIPAALKPKAS